MLGRDPFRHDLLRKYTAAFGTLFNEVRITHLDAEGGLEQLIRVPLSYGPKEKLLARVQADPEIDRQAATLLPRMTFEMTGIVYQPQNKLGSSRKFVINRSDAGVATVLNPVPYDLQFSLWIFTKYVEDGNQIVEQILPYFTPVFTPTLSLMNGVVLDCPVRLDSCRPNDGYQGAFQDRRVLMWTLEFTMTGYLFGPEIHRPLIKFVQVDLFNAPLDPIRDNIGQGPAIDRVTVQPGLTANGQPTTNVSLSVPYSQINVGDDWDYIVTTYGHLP